MVIAIVLTGNKGKKEIQQGEKTVINEEQYTEELADVTNTQNTKHKTWSRSSKDNNYGWLYFRIERWNLCE